MLNRLSHRYKIHNKQSQVNAFKVRKYSLLISILHKELRQPIPFDSVLLITITENCLKIHISQCNGHRILIANL